METEPYAKHFCKAGGDYFLKEAITPRDCFFREKKWAAKTDVALPSIMALEQKEDIARLKRDLDERQRELHAAERNLYRRETKEKLEWREETYMGAFKKELKVLEDANEAAKDRYEELVRLRACIDARAMETIHDENASPSDKKNARITIARHEGGSDDELAHLRRTFIQLSPFYR